MERARSVRTKHLEHQAPTVLNVRSVSATWGPRAGRMTGGAVLCLLFVSICTPVYAAYITDWKFNPATGHYYALLIRT